MRLKEMRRAIWQFFAPPVPTQAVDDDRYLLERREIGVKEVRERYRTYLVTHYLGLHITLVSVALAVAGVTAGTLLSRHVRSPLDLAVLWVMWLGSAAAMAVAYGGPMVGAFALPSSIPGIGDLVIPLLIGIVEILLFTILATLHSITYALNAWLILVALFAGLAGIGVLVAMSHYQNGILKEIYSTDLASFIKTYKRFLRRDATEAAIAAVIAALGATLRISHAITLPVLTFPLLITGMLLLGLCGHELTARMWRTVLSRAAIEDKPPSEQTPRS
jgi:hypothetical protein